MKRCQHPVNLQQSCGSSIHLFLNPSFLWCWMVFFVFFCFYSHVAFSLVFEAGLRPCKFRRKRATRLARGRPGNAPQLDTTVKTIRSWGCRAREHGHVTRTWLHSCSLEEISERPLVIVLVLQSVADVVPEFGVVLVHLEEAKCRGHAKKCRMW